MPTRQLDSIQALRAIAALWVVMFHTVGNAATYGWTLKFLPALAKQGEMGVDIFFVISGFVIALISYGKPVGFYAARRFVTARVARVIPLYWTLTALFTLLLVCVPSAFGHAHLSYWHVISSFLFIPSLNWAGITAPVINVGWTLNYEIWFYALFALAISVTQKPIGTVMAVMTALAVAHPLHDGSLLWNFYTSSIVLEFAGGIILGAFYAKYKNISPFTMMPVALVIGLSIVQYAPKVTEETRFIALGIPALLIVACALSLEDRFRWNRCLCSLGDASYSLYLTHVLTVPASLKLIQIMDRRHGILGDAVCLIAIGLSVALAFACRRYVERPMTRIVRSWLDHPGAVH